MVCGMGNVTKPAVDKRPEAVGTRSPDNDLNRRIVALLEQDGRMAFSEIAQELSVSEGTIRNRVAGMKDSGMLRIVAIADPVAGEYQTDAMLGLRVSSGHTPESVAERLCAEASVIYVMWVAGRFDLLVEVVSDDRDSFLLFLDQHIHSMSDIAEVEVMLGLKNLKNQFLLKRDWESENART